MRFGVPDFKIEKWVVERRLEAPAVAGRFDITVPLRFWQRACADPMREMHLEVRFHPDAIPVSAERMYAMRGHPERAEPVMVRGASVGASIESLMLDLGPGYAGLSWVW